MEDNTAIREMISLWASANGVALIVLVLVAVGSGAFVLYCLDALDKRLSHRTDLDGPAPDSDAPDPTIGHPIP